MESNQLGSENSRPAEDRRSSPRFHLDIKIKIHSHSSGLLEGRTVDISESGIAAMLKIEVPLNEVVQLDFELPEGRIEVAAQVRQRNAFRYGFQFVEQGPVRDMIALFCWQLSQTQSSGTESIL